QTHLALASAVTAVFAPPNIGQQAAVVPHDAGNVSLSVTLATTPGSDNSLISLSAGNFSHELLQPITRHETSIDATSRRISERPFTTAPTETHGSIPETPLALATAPAAPPATSGSSGPASSQPLSTSVATSPLNTAVATPLVDHPVEQVGVLVS